MKRYSGDSGESLLADLAAILSKLGSTGDSTAEMLKKILPVLCQIFGIGNGLACVMAVNSWYMNSGRGLAVLGGRTTGSNGK